jgi:hypothetical protein
MKFHFCAGTANRFFSVCDLFFIHGLREQSHIPLTTSKSAAVHIVRVQQL